MHPITVYSFGYLHPMPEDLPPFDITVDLRRLLADPAPRPKRDMLDMTGLDAKVRRFVMSTPGAYTVIHSAMYLVSAAAFIHPMSLAFGSAGGQHRSVVCAEEVARLLEGATGREVIPVHLHVHLPRVIRQETKS